MRCPHTLSIFHSTQFRYLYRLNYRLSCPLHTSPAGLGILRLSRVRHGRTHASHWTIISAKPDGNIAQSSPADRPTHNYSPYSPQHEISQCTEQPMSAAIPDWAGQYQQPTLVRSPATVGGNSQRFGVEKELLNKLYSRMSSNS